MKFLSLLFLLKTVCSQELFEQDIKPITEQINYYYSEIIPDGGNDHRNKLWENGILYYDIQEPFYHKEKITKAIESIEQYTDIKIVKDSTKSDRVLLVNKPGCSSYVGKIGGIQTINLYHTEEQRHCMSKGTIVHELLHALGMWHEQSVYNRDNYIRVNYQNIISGGEHNFDKRNGVENMDIPYDYESVMHYSSRAGSKNGWNTIDAINPDGTINDENTNIMGRRGEMSLKDTIQLHLMYNCPNAVRNLSELCSSDCKCKEGQGNCNNDGDCEAGLFCEQNVGVYSYKIKYISPGLNVCKNKITQAPSMSPTYSKNTRKCIKHTELCNVKRSLCEREIYNNKNWCKKLLETCDDKIDEYCN